VNPRTLGLILLGMTALTPTALIIFETGSVTSAIADRTVAARIGEVWIQNEAGAAPYHQGWVEGLRQLGYVEGQNLILLTRYANGDESRLPLLLNELIRLQVDVLVVSARAIRPAQTATTTIPIVCATMNDPVSEGLVTSLGRPGGNVTGVSWQAPDTATKRLELAMELRPKLTRLAVLFDSNDRVAQLETEIVASAAQKAKISVGTFDVHGLTDVRAAFASMAKSRPQALHVVQTAITAGLREQIAALAIKARVPMISGERSLAEAGGLLTYGPKLAPVLRRGAAYVDRILKGAKPADLPIEQPTKFELVVNLKTAKALGITIPQSILLRADEVIR
jgi:putative ABC transport system substrate-binding protein